MSKFNESVIMEKEELEKIKNNQAIIIEEIQKIHQQLRYRKQPYYLNRGYPTAGNATITSEQLKNYEIMGYVAVFSPLIAIMLALLVRGYFCFFFEILKRKVRKRTRQSEIY